VAFNCEILESAAGSLDERISRRIGSQKYLIILDNCDHVLDAMQDLDHILKTCPKFKNPGNEPRESAIKLGIGHGNTSSRVAEYRQSSGAG